jgi:hypothetical protein
MFFLSVGRKINLRLFCLLITVYFGVWRVNTTIAVDRMTKKNKTYFFLPVSQKKFILRILLMCHAAFVIGARF